MSVTEPSEIMASAVFETSSSATILIGSPAAMKFIAVWVAMLPHCSWPGGKRGVDVGIGVEVDDLDVAEARLP